MAKLRSSGWRMSIDSDDWSCGEKLADAVAAAPRRLLNHADVAQHAAVGRLALTAGGAREEPAVRRRGARTLDHRREVRRPRGPRERDRQILDLRVVARDLHPEVVVDREPHRFVDGEPAHLRVRRLCRRRGDADRGKGDRQHGGLNRCHTHSLMFTFSLVAD